VKMCEILPKYAKNLLVTTLKILQLMGDFVPRPYLAVSLDPAGDSRPQTPCGFAPASQTSSRCLWISQVPIARGGPSVPPNFWGPFPTPTRFDVARPKSARQHTLRRGVFRGQSTPLYWRQCVAPFVSDMSFLLTFLHVAI